MGSWAERTRGKVAAGGPGVPHSCADKPGGITGERDRPTTQGSSGEIKPQTSDCKHLRGLRRQWEKLPALQESPLERPMGS